MADLNAATVFSSELLDRIRKQHRAGAFVNRNYEGELFPGKTVKIQRINNVTTFNPDDGWQTQTLNEDELSVTVDEKSAFNYEVDDVDELFSNADLREGHVEEASFSLMDDADEFIFDQLKSAATGASNDLDATGLASNASGFAGLVRDADTQLSENDVPRAANRTIAVSPHYRNLLSEYLEDNLDSMESAMTGIVGSYSGFRIVESNNLPKTNESGSGGNDTVWMPFSVPMANTYADNMVKTERYSPEEGFAEALKGLMVYGYKNTHSKAVGVLKADIPS